MRTSSAEMLTLTLAATAGLGLGSIRPENYIPRRKRARTYRPAPEVKVEAPPEVTERLQAANKPKTIRGSARNAPCTCGCGRKAKKCGGDQ